MLAGRLLHGLDAALFAKDVLGMDLDPWQAEVLRSTSDRLMLNCCRQSGKSTTTSIKAVHTALYQPGTLTLVVSPSQRQSSELFLKITEVLDHILSSSKWEEDTKTSVTLGNGSRIVSLPGSEKTIRGYSAPALVLIDEAARILDELMVAIRPMVATNGGKIVMLSTPWGKRGVFYEAWEHGGPGWERIKVPADQCPRISPAFLESERQGMPPLMFASEYLCEFTDTVDSVFRWDDIQAALTHDLTPLFEAVSI